MPHRLHADHNEEQDDPYHHHHHRTLSYAIFAIMTIILITLKHIVAYESEQAQQKMCMTDSMCERRIIPCSKTASIAVSKRCHRAECIYCHNECSMTASDMRFTVCVRQHVRASICNNSCASEHVLATRNTECA